MKINKLLEKQGESYSTAVAAARRLGRLEREILAKLPAEIVPHIRLLHIRQDRITLGVDTNAWLNRLHYMKREILKLINEIESIAPISQIVLKLQTKAIVPPRRRRAASLSPRSAEHIEAAAATTEDRRLREALLRLAGRAGKKQNRSD